MSPSELLDTLRLRGLIVAIKPPAGLRVVRAAWAPTATPTDMEMAALKRHRVAVVKVIRREAVEAVQACFPLLARLPQALRDELTPLLWQAADRYLLGHADATSLTTLIWRVSVMAGEVAKGVPVPGVPAAPRATS
jgi:hypothetical protein